MNGPLANEFALLRDRHCVSYEHHRAAEPDCTFCAALARIEEHTHNTEKALRFMEDFIVEHGLHDAMVEAGKPAALSAGEGTPA